MVVSVFKKTSTEVCPQAERPWDEMHGIGISQKYPPFPVCAWPLPFFLLPQEAPTLSISIHFYPAITPVLCCTEERSIIHFSSYSHSQGPQLSCAAV